MSDVISTPSATAGHTATRRGRGRGPSLRLGDTQREGLGLLAGIVALMWLLEVINTIDSNGLDGDGIYARNFDRLWGILTAPFIHASFAHLISNTVPFLFMGAIIALRGAARLAVVTLIVIAIGGLGTWLISPGNSVTIGASGIVFGYATYLLARGFFDRSLLELLTGLIVGAVWGAALIASLVPQQHISWQGHLSGAVAGVIAAYLLRREPAGRAGLRDDPDSASGTRPGASAGALPG